MWLPVGGVGQPPRTGLTVLRNSTPLPHTSSTKPRTWASRGGSAPDGSEAAAPPPHSKARAPPDLPGIERIFPRGRSGGAGIRPLQHLLDDLRQTLLHALLDLRVSKQNDALRRHQIQPSEPRRAVNEDEGLASAAGGRVRRPPPFNGRSTLFLRMATRTEALSKARQLVGDVARCGRARPPGFASQDRVAA